MVVWVCSNNDVFCEVIVCGDFDGDDMYGGVEEFVEEG